MGGCQSPEQLAVTPHNDRVIKLIARTPLNTLANLYDYSANYDKTTVKVFPLENSLTIIKNKTDYSLISNDQEINTESQIEIIVNIYQQLRGNQLLYQLYNNKQSKSQIWVAVHSLPNQMYAIKETDVIRIGKLKIIVKEIVTDSETKDEKDEIFNFKYNTYSKLDKSAEAQFNSNETCRVCLEEGQLTNPLISPCGCTGSARYIHLCCIKQWLNKTINPRKVGQSTVINWKKLICELCSQSLPFKVYLDGRKYYTVDIPKPKKPYIVLNPLNMQPNDHGKLYYLVSFNQHVSVTVGRKSNCGVIIGQDSTVSRHHCTLIMQKNLKSKPKIFIKDNESKYGTLILIKKPIPIIKYFNGIILQINNSILTVEHSKTNSPNLDNKNIILELNESSESHSEPSAQEINDSQIQQSQAKQ